MRHAAEFSETWPMIPEDPLPFLRAMGDFHMTARSIVCTSGEKVGNARCGRQRFIRWAVASLDRFEPKVFNGATGDHIEILLPEGKDSVNRHFNFGATPVTNIRKATGLAFWEIGVWCCISNACKTAADISLLADTSPKQAQEWRRTREVVLHQATDRWSMWPLTLPDVLAEWCNPTDDVNEAI